MFLTRYRNNNLLPAFRNMESWFDRFFSDDGFFGEGTEAGFLPALNIATEGDDYVISAELPGVKPEEVKLDFDEGVLTISGEKKSDSEDKDKNYHRIEIRHGKFARKVRLPDHVDPESIKAVFENGVLSIRVQKAESAKPRQITIESK
ncbi:MAG: Hsp20/alpha crystallin family protein [Planctomycetota bacterium]|jgi:HSP20 family protein